MRCPHCGARNASEAAGQPCVSCGRVLPGAKGGGRSAFEELQQVGGLADFDPGSPLGRLGRDDLDTADDGLDGGLGAMPTGDEAARLDMAQLLGTDSANDGAPFFGAGGGDGFRFGGADSTDGLGSLDGGFAAFDDDEEATRGALMVQIPPEALRDSLTLNLSGPPGLSDDGEEESTRVVDQRYVDEAMKAAPLDLGLDAPTPEGWKVRNERGVVYELMTVDAVVAWLEGKPDISGVRVARGDGVFMEVDAFPELAGRLGVRKPVEDSLSLDITRASARHGGAIGEQRSVARAESGPAREPGPPSSGFGAVLGAVAIAFLAVVGITVAGVATGAMALPPDIDAPVAVEQPPAADLARAIQDYESGAYDAAINRLQLLARGEQPDPRIQRYLALALHHNNRDAEARRALAEYRRQMRAEPGR